VDLLDYDGMEELIPGLVKSRGKIDGIIHSAGISTILPFKMVSVKKMEEYFSTNVYAAFNLSRIATRAEFFAEAGGSVVFIASVMGFVGEGGRSLYGMTKGALSGGCKSLAVEFAKRKIRFNTVSPGVVETNMSSKTINALDEEARNKILQAHPLGLGTPEDVVGACIYLLSDAARWVTGTNLFVDGGYTAR
jgi:NAD(P)-dependent dehydrogenase (short-subunit alcohol dehydrogenase family)